jgi:hypothetical protein
MDFKSGYKYILGDYIGFEESLKDEFKEFMFKITPEFYFSNQQVYDYVKTGVLEERIFNDFVLENLEQYLFNFVDKYNASDLFFPEKLSNLIKSKLTDLQLADILTTMKLS